MKSTKKDQTHPVLPCLTYRGEVILYCLRHLLELQDMRMSNAFGAGRGRCRGETAWCMFMDVKHALLLLPVQQRRAIGLHLVFGLTQEESARHLGTSRPNLRRRVFSGLQNLQRNLNQSQGPAVVVTLAPREVGSHGLKVAS